MSCPLFEDRCCCRGMLVFLLWSLKRQASIVLPKQQPKPVSTKSQCVCGGRLSCHLNCFIHFKIEMPHSSSSFHFSLQETSDKSVIELQQYAKKNKPNLHILNKLQEEMKKLAQERVSVFLTSESTCSSHSGGDLFNELPSMLVCSRYLLRPRYFLCYICFVLLFHILPSYNFKSFFFLLRFASISEVCVPVEAFFSVSISRSRNHF